MNSSDPELLRCAHAAAEEVLRLIYGEDLQGCVIRIDAVAAAILEPFQEQAASEREVRSLYEKAFEAIDLLATPPLGGEALGPDGVRSLLGERLDAIRTLTGKVLHATAVQKAAGEAA